jgi:two-component system sensor histidine kinase CpxA
MRSLFAKIFTWFWMAMILVMVTFVAITLTLQRDSLAITWRNVASKVLAVNGQTALEVFEKGGPLELRAYFKELERSSDLKMFLFDETGSSLSEKEPPPDVKNMAFTITDKRDFEFNRLGEIPLAAKRLSGKGGKVYVIVSEVPVGPFVEFFRMPLKYLGSVFAVIVMAGLVCFWLARYLTAPIRDLQSAARRFANGELKVRVGSHVCDRRDEIADLGRDFDMMAEQIEKLMISQRRLIRDISHELRSPLTRLSVALELARQHGEQKTAESLDRIGREAEKLNELIGQLLGLSRLDSDSERLEKIQIDLTELIEKIIQDVDLEAERGKCSVRFSCREEIILEGVKDLLRSAVENVIRNAVRHAPEGSEVEVSLGSHRQNEDAFVLIQVRDHGPGVPAGEIQNLFRPFFRVADARERASGGSGLGLAIAERAVHLHGGTIRAANASGGGLLVEILLPVLENPESTIDFSRV